MELGAGIRGLLGPKTAEDRALVEDERATRVARGEAAGKNVKAKAGLTDRIGARLSDVDEDGLSEKKLARLRAAQTIHEERTAEGGRLGVRGTARILMKTDPVLTVGTAAVAVTGATVVVGGAAAMGL